MKKCSKCEMIFDEWDELKHNDKYDYDICPECGGECLDYDEGWEAYNATQREIH